MTPAKDRVLQPLLHCTQKRRWVATNLGPACLELGPSPVTTQDVITDTHIRVHPSPRLVCSDRPEGRVLSCVDPSAPQTISAVCVRRTCISVLRAVPLPPCLHKSYGGGCCSPQRARCSHPHSLGISVASTGTWCANYFRTQNKPW